MDWSQALWRARLCSAFRTTLACSVVAVVTLYGPYHLRHFVAFPAYSYLTTILIVMSDATLGDSLRSFWHVGIATVQVVPPAIFSLWLVHPDKFTIGMAAVAVGIGAFAVALPESTHLMSKRIAMGQIVIIYVGVVVDGASTQIVMHPLHVAASSVLGAFAAVLALLLPFPRLAIAEVKQAGRRYAENASERINLYVKAFSAKDNQAALDLISQAKSLSASGTKLIHSIELKQEGMIWERPDFRFLKPNYLYPGDRLQNVELLINGIEISFSSCSSFPRGLNLNQGLRDSLLKMEAGIGLKLEQAKCSFPLGAPTAPETKVEAALDNSLWILNSTSPTRHDLPVLFFLSCMKRCQDDSFEALNSKSVTVEGMKQNIQQSSEPQLENKFGIFKRIFCYWKTRLSSEMMVFPVKCSVSLSLAVLFGLIYNRNNGYWSGLTIAISFVTGRQATFTVANARGQGTVMGSVYGILGCFIFRRYEKVRVILLVPWIIFTTFLNHSRMYGQAGAISAVIGALLILGRENYGLPSEFAIARIAEAFIGLSCFVLVELLVQPNRATTLAKFQLSNSLKILQLCIRDISIGSDLSASSIQRRRENHRRMIISVVEFAKFIQETDQEPNLWFMPFDSCCFNHLLRSLSKMVTLLHFVADMLEFLQEELQKAKSVAWMELQTCIDSQIATLKDRISSSLKCLEEVATIKSFAAEDMNTANAAFDIESGMLPHANAFRPLGADKEEMEMIIDSVLKHSNEAIQKIQDTEAAEDLKNQLTLWLSGLVFCMSLLIKETIALEKEIREHNRREDPSTQIDLYEILRKISSSAETRN